MSWKSNRIFFQGRCKETYVVGTHEIKWNGRQMDGQNKTKERQGEERWDGESGMSPWWLACLKIRHTWTDHRLSCLSFLASNKTKEVCQIQNSAIDFPIRCYGKPKWTFWPTQYTPGFNLLKFCLWGCSNSTTTTTNTTHHHQQQQQQHPLAALSVISWMHIIF